MRVWVVQPGGYDEYGVHFVAADIDTAVAKIKANYPDPYIVAWDDVQRNDHPPGTEDHYLIGHFEYVPNYSVKHKAHWIIEPFEVQTSQTAQTT